MIWLARHYSAHFAFEALKWGRGQVWLRGLALLSRVGIPITTLLSPSRHTQSGHTCNEKHHRESEIFFVFFLGTCPLKWTHVFTASWREEITAVELLQIINLWPLPAWSLLAGLWQHGRCMKGHTQALPSGLWILMQKHAYIYPQVCMHTHT